MDYVVYTKREMAEIGDGLDAAKEVFDAQDRVIALAKGWVAIDRDNPVDAAYREAGRTLLAILDPEE